MSGGTAPAAGPGGGADRSVRPARAGDLPALGAVHAAAWRAAYTGLLPADLLAELSGPALAEQWRTAVTRPPSVRHRVLVACAGDRVVGFAALAPAGDLDLDPAADAELHALVVDPADTGAGHGSRLLHAVADVARADGCTRVCTWVAEPDQRLRGFLTAAGWAADGATRSLDLRGDGAVVVRQHRLHTGLA